MKKDNQSAQICANEKKMKPNLPETSEYAGSLCSDRDGERRRGDFVKEEWSSK